MVANYSENSTYVSAIKKLENIENNTVCSLKSKATGSRPPCSENSSSHNNASVGNVVEVNQINQLASSPPLPSLEMVIETEVMQEEQPVKPHSKDHAGAVMKSNPGKEKKQQIKPEGKSTTVSSSKGKGTLSSPQSDFIEPDSKKRCRPASPNNAGISTSNAFSILDEGHSSKKQAVVNCSVDKSSSPVNQNAKIDPASSRTVSGKPSNNHQREQKTKVPKVTGCSKPVMDKKHHK